MTTKYAIFLIAHYRDKAYSIALNTELLANESDPSERSKICAELAGLYKLASILEPRYPEAVQYLKAEAPDIYYHITTEPLASVFDTYKKFA